MADIFKIALGAKVKDCVTELEGVVVARTEWLSGCIRYTVQPQGMDKEDKVKESYCVDEQQLVLVGDAVDVEAPSGSPGGPKPSPRRQSAPSRGCG